MGSKRTKGNMKAMTLLRKYVVGGVLEEFWWSLKRKSVRSSTGRIRRSNVNIINTAMFDEESSGVL